MQVGFLGPTALIPHYRTGVLRFLAQSSKTRAQSLPEVPTFEEAGFGGMVLESWYGAFVPAGTPAAVVSYLNAEMGKAVGDAATRASMLQTATEPVGGSAEAFGRVLRDDSAKYARLARELNIRISGWIRTSLPHNGGPAMRPAADDGATRHIGFDRRRVLAGALVLALPGPRRPPRRLPFRTGRFA